MQEVTNKFMTDPSLLWGLVIAVITMAVALIWLVRWILNKLLPVLEANTSAMKQVSDSSDDLQISIKDLHKTMNEFLIKIASK